MEWRRGGYEISTDPERLDVERVWRFLRTSYWAANVPRDVVERSIAGSLVFGLYAPDGAQAGFARVVTDGVTFGWLADVFVLEPHRGQGLGVWLVECVLDHLREVPKLILGTADAHGLYARFGFEQPDPTRMMTRVALPEEVYGPLEEGS
jgi:GNAT superfamily N-acetyltransferase